MVGGRRRSALLPGLLCWNGQINKKGVVSSLGALAEKQISKQKNRFLCAVCFKPQRYTSLPTQQCDPSTDCCEGLGCSVACLARVSPSFSCLTLPTSGKAGDSTAVLEWAPPLRSPQGRKLHLSHSALYSLALASQACVTTPRQRDCTHRMARPCLPTRVFWKVGK